jgi:histone-lysine N-methyltransferase SETMAR
MRDAFRHTAYTDTPRILDHPPYSPNLAPSGFHLFLHLKKYLAEKKFDNDDKVQEEVMTWIKGQAADFYDSGI